MSRARSMRAHASGSDARSTAPLAPVSQCRLSTLV